MYQRHPTVISRKLKERYLVVRDLNDFAIASTKTLDEAKTLISKLGVHSSPNDFYIFDTQTEEIYYPETSVTWSKDT